MRFSETAYIKEEKCYANEGNQRAFRNSKKTFLDPVFCDIIICKTEMVKKLQKQNAKQPVRQSHRIRVLNIRLGTPPKILLNMLGDHSSSIVKNSFPAVANVKRIENVSQEAAKIPNKQNAKSSNIVAQLSDAGPNYRYARQRNSRKRYSSPFEEVFKFGHSSKSVSNETVEETSAFGLNKSKKAEVSRNSKNERNHILNKALDNMSSKSRHSSRIRIPNSRFDYLLPGFVEQSGNGKRRDSMENGKNKKANMLSLISEEKIIARNPKIGCGKSDISIRLRHSERQHIPSKRFCFPNIYPVIRVQKKSNKAESKMGKTHVKVQKCKCKNSKKKPVSVLKTRLSMETTSRNLSLSSIASNRQVHSSLEVPSVLYPYRPARNQALCVQSSSSITKDYVSKKDVEELLVEIKKALALITDEDYGELHEKIAHHLNNLHRENCRLRQALHHLRSELDSLSSNSTVNRCNLLMKQNSELREQKILADIKCEAQMDKTHKLLERIKILEIRNKDLENFRNQLVKQKKQKHLNSETKYPHIDFVNDLSKMEMQDLMDAELDSLILNGIDKEVVKSDESNNDKVEWGNDSWMLHC
ncbi:DNA-directed RNA polymerase subunit beta' [Dirofilaria immitis]